MNYSEITVTQEEYRASSLELTVKYDSITVTKDGKKIAVISKPRGKLPVCFDEPYPVKVKQCVRCKGEGQIIVDLWEDAEGCERIRHGKCPVCEGRTYALPPNGFYVVKVLTYSENKLRCARVEDGAAEFTDSDWDLSTEVEVEWLHKIAELDGGAPLL